MRASQIRATAVSGATTALALAFLALALPAAASAHARVSPPVSLAGQLQLYSLAVPTEKSNLTTVRIVMRVPHGFSIDSFSPPPGGWHQSLRESGTGNGATVTQVTWNGGHTPTGEDSLFQFLGQPAAAGKYTFGVQQTYSDGSVVTWNGSESSAAPAPAIEAVSSFGAGTGGNSTLSIVALIIGTIGLLAAGLALAGGKGSSSGSASGRSDGRPLV